MCRLNKARNSAVPVVITRGACLSDAQVELRRLKHGVSLADIQKAAKGNNCDEIIFKEQRR